MNGLKPGWSWCGPAGVWCECARDTDGMEMFSSAVGPGRSNWLDSVGKYCGAWVTEKEEKTTLE